MAGVGTVRDFTYGLFVAGLILAFLVWAMGAIVR